MLVNHVDYEPQNILCMEIRGADEKASCLGVAVAFDKPGGKRYRKVANVKLTV